jgi:sugar phosphate isomerase/epimerase
VLEAANALDVRVVQIADNMPLHQMSDDALDRLRDRARQLDIELEVGTRGLDPARLLRYLEIALRLGARLVRTLLPMPMAGSKPDFVQLEACIREILPAFEASGVFIAVENYERYSYVDLLRLVQSVSSPHVGICLDTLNSLGAVETPREVVSALAPYTLNLHVKDFQIRRIESGLGYLVSGCAAGDGLLDIDWVVGELTQNRREVSLIVELWTPFAGSVQETIVLEREWAARSVAFLKKYEGAVPAAPIARH